MSRPEDIATLFTGGKANEPFRQGRIITFDPATGANAVEVGGAVLTNLPILVGGDTVNFAPGDAAILLKYQSSWAILGRIVTPGSEQLTAAAVGFGGVGVSAFGWAPATGGGVVVASADVNVPVWANQALVLALASLTLQNNSGGDGIFYASAGINGTFGGENYTLIPNSHYDSISVHAQRSDLAVTGGSTFTVQAKARVGSIGWTANPSNLCNLDAIVVFRKV